MIHLPRPRARRALVLATAATLLALPATPASADTDAPVSSADLDCTITVTTDVYPGVTTELQHVAVTSHGLTGTADCTGTIDGATVTGPGTFAVTIEETANCTQLAGQGEFVLQVPTTGGIATVTGRTDFAFGPGISGSSFTGDLTGTGETIATEGDCVNTPLTQGTTRFEGTVIT